MKKPLPLIALILVILTSILFVLNQRSHEEQISTSLVNNLPEFQELKKLIDKNGKSTLNLEITERPTKESPYYIIRVYEAFPDHRATVNWYRVSPDGKIWQQDLSTVDKWDLIYPKPTKVNPKK